MGNDLEVRMNAKQIVESAGMSGRPEYYSGRGAITCDLNSEILEKVYQEIGKTHGKKAANQFTHMVADIPKLSATDFLLALYRLEGRGWKWDKKMLGGEKGIYIDGPTIDAKRMVCLATIAEAFCGSGSRDETDYIRRGFLAKHGIKTARYSDKSHFIYDIA